MDWKLITAFAAMAGFMVAIMITRTNALDDRMRELEIWRASMECYINPEICRAVRR